MNLFSRFLTCLLLFSAGTVFAATPTTIHATYDIYKLGIKIGQVDETYQRDKDHYTLVSTTRAVGVFSLFKSGKVIVRSSGLIDNSGLKPLNSTAETDNNEKARKRAEFDWDAKKITVTLPTQNTTLKLAENTQDRLSAMYQFMFLPLQEPTLAFQMLNGSYLLNFRFDVTPGPDLKTPAGKFNTIYLDNKAQKAKERTELWLAKEQYHLPCKMIVTDADGGKITQILNKLDITP